MTDTAKTAHAAIAGLTYKVELKASSAKYAPQLAKWGHPARVYVRGYDEQGKRQYQETIGYCDSRCTGPKSNAGRMLEKASERARELSALH